MGAILGSANPLHFSALYLIAICLYYALFYLQQVRNYIAALISPGLLFLKIPGNPLVENHLPTEHFKREFLQVQAKENFPGKILCCNIKTSAGLHLTKHNSIRVEGKYKN